jgi:hypothetical protein
LFTGSNFVATDVLRWFCLAVILTLGVEPAGADSVYSFRMSEGLAPWQSWMPVERTADGISMTLPGRLDPNHLDGIGPLWLLANMNLASVGAPGYLDLNDAEISIRLRARNVELRGARLLWWLAARLPKADTAQDYPWQETNWALTCCDLGPVLGPKWQTYKVRLNQDPSRWTYAGGNSMSLGDWGERFLEYPVAKVMKSFTGTLHLALVGRNAATPPTGKIEIGEISIRTRKPATPLPLEDIDPFVARHEWEAVRWHIKRLLPTDDSPVNYHYGRILVNGFGGPQDYTEGAAYLQKAIALPEARYELAKLYLYGLGVPRDPARAVQLLESEGTKGLPDARYQLGLAREAGIGTDRDDRRALQDFLYAAQRGHPHAMHELARKFLTDQPEQSYFWYRLSRDRLTRDTIGAQVEMLDWNINRLRASFKPDQLADLDRLVKQWTPMQSN